MKYFIADLHNMDNNILTYEHRPFKSVEDMRNTIIKNWNNTVKEDDEVYLLGDIGDPEILKYLKGNIIIVLGNHDNEKNIPKGYEINKYPIMIDAYWLSHAPIGYMPPECPYLNIHGHLHRFNYGLLDRTWSSGNRYFCVSVEQINYTPISEEEIGKLLQYR